MDSRLLIVLLPVPRLCTLYNYDKNVAVKAPRTEGNEYHNATDIESG
jgi:hypothetical protein